MSRFLSTKPDKASLAIALRQCLRDSFCLLFTFVVGFGAWFPGSCRNAGLRAGPVSAILKEEQTKSDGFAPHGHFLRGV